MIRNTSKSGFIGILVVMIAVSITLLLFVKTYFTETKNSPASTRYDGLIMDINAAQNVANQQNIKAIETNKVLNSLK